MAYTLNTLSIIRLRLQLKTYTARDSTFLTKLPLSIRIIGCKKKAQPKWQNDFAQSYLLPINMATGKDKFLFYYRKLPLK